LIVDLRLHSGLGRVFVYAGCPDPSQNLVLSQICVGRVWRTGFIGHRAGGVDRAVISSVCAGTGPVDHEHYVRLPIGLGVAVELGDFPVKCGHDFP